MENINTNDNFDFIDFEDAKTIEDYHKIAKKHREIIRHLKAELSWTSERMITYKKFGEFYASPEFENFMKFFKMMAIILTIIIMSMTIKLVFKCN